jgi:Tfp pilus assembly protein PilX
VRQPRSRATNPLQRLLRDEEGIALVLALAVTVIIGMVGSTLMMYSTSNQQNADRSSFDSTAHGLAEAGINNAMAVLSNPSNNAICDPATTCTSLLPNSLATANVSPYDDGYVKWWATFDRTTTTWTLNAIGYMRNPTGSAIPVTRRITARTKVRPSLMQPSNNPAWNYIMATRTGTAGGCDESLSNSVNIQSPLYVMGNLCMNTPSQVTGGPLMVKGGIRLDVNTNVGSPGTPVNEVHARAGCSYKGGAYDIPCKPNDKVWAGISDANPIDLTAPAADFTAWYRDAVPGPRQACTESSGAVPVFDTSDGVMNNSVPGVFNLTPGSTDYSCIVRNPVNAIVGQLTWDHTAKTLTVSGTIFIDGSVTVDYGSPNVPIQYNGQGTLYLGGTFLLSNTKLCAGIANGTCDFNSWNPNSEMLVIVANGNGGQVTTGDSIQLKSSFFEGGLWATNAIELNTSSQTEGPMVGSNVILENTVFARTWPAVTVPAGMPGNPVIYAQADPPTGYSS